ncbi:MAG: amidohydrolase family protein [Planctomycetota bacterium]|jgi:predicted TIM-barrel fold metal-dependent hydrolase
MTGSSAARTIDAHGHGDVHGYDFERVVANMDECGIEKTWLLTWEAPADECDPAYTGKMGGSVFPGASGPVPFERCLRYKERAPERFVLGYMPDPRSPGAIDRLAAAVDIYGVRICGELKCRMTYDNPDALRLFRFCGERDLPVTVHIDYEFDSAGHRGVPRDRLPRSWPGLLGAYLRRRPVRQGGLSRRAGQEGRQSGGDAPPVSQSLLRPFRVLGAERASAGREVHSGVH